MRLLRGRSWGVAFVGFLLFAAFALLVQYRALVGPDQAAMRLVAGSRPLNLADGMNWIFRLGFAQLDCALAIVWAGYLLLRRRPIGVIVAPLLLVVATVVQAGTRLVVDQPAPRAEFEIQRSVASQSLARGLDEADAAVRSTFLAVTAPATATASSGVVPPPSQERGSFPSGHAARIGFLALMAGSAVEGIFRRGTPARIATSILVAIALLVGYSALFFGYHWPSDVIGGYLLALGTYGVARRLGYT